MMVIPNTALIEEFCFTQKQVVYEEICVLMEKFYHIVSYIFLLLFLCILIVMYVLFCVFVFIMPTDTFSYPD